MTGCSVIDAPSDLGLRRTGVRGLPAALRGAGLLEGVPDVRYAGRIPVPAYVPLRDESTGILNSRGIVAFSHRLAERVGFTLDLGRFPLVLGGDCSILLGSALALRRRGRYGLFFLDGHAGAAAAAKQGVSALEESELEGFWVHLDADVLHDEVMPAVDYRMPDYAERSAARVLAEAVTSAFAQAT